MTRLTFANIRPTRVFDSSGYNLYYTAGNVGIGTSATTASLEVSGNVNIDNGLLYVDGSNNRVGIGMTNPSKPLEISGNIRVSNIMDISGATNITGNLAVKTNVLVVDTSNNRVGIGKTNPNVSLDVAGNVSATSFTGTISTASQTSITSVGTLSSLAVSGTTQLTGNTGIGKTPTSYALDVNGTINCTSLLQNGSALSGSKWTSSGSNIYYSSGNVGVGIASPSYPLHVVGSAYNGTLGGYSIYMGYSYVNGSSIPNSSVFSGSSGGVISSAASLNPPISICVNHGIWANAFFASSDSRIKTNIQDLNDPQCLSMINAIQPKTYEYVDKVARGYNTVYGFIAQQVQEVLPRAVSIQTETIPSIYRLAERNGSQLTLIDPSGERDLTQLLKSGDKVRLYDVSDNQIHITVVSVDSSTSFTYSSSEQLTDSQYFVYGKEVDDFHTLNKEYIFTINVCATQELSRKVDALEALRTTHDALEARISQLESENSAKQSLIERLYAHLGLTV